MRVLATFLLALLLCACNIRGAGNHENVGANAPALKEYADEGYDLSKPWPVTFNVLVDGEKDADGLAAALDAKGYYVEYGPQGGGIWWLEATKDAVPTLAMVDAGEKEVVALSDRFDGYYEGWNLDTYEKEGEVAEADDEEA